MPTFIRPAKVVVSEGMDAMVILAACAMLALAAAAVWFCITYAAALMACLGVLAAVAVAEVVLAAIYGPRLAGYRRYPLPARTGAVRATVLPRRPAQPQVIVHQHYWGVPPAQQPAAIEPPRSIPAQYVITDPARQEQQS